MASAIWVPGKVITIRQGGYSQRKFQRGHWADAAGRWLGYDRSIRPGTSRTSTVPTGAHDVLKDGSDFGYHGLSDDEINARANAYADSAIAAKTASIERMRQQAAQQAQRDEEMFQGLGQAQMGMINQIPANIQAIRNTAGQAIASFGGQVTGAQQQQAQGELAQNAAFSASQLGATPPAAPPPADGAAPAPAPAGGPIGVDPAAAAAAENAMGGTIPATSQAEVGAASAIAASGMPAVVARSTQIHVAQRMAQAASEDADYRQQLIDAAAERGGAYQDALNSLYDIETKKFGIYQAQQNLEQDRQDMELKKQQMALQVRAELANEVQFGIKTKAQADKEWRNYQLAQQRVQISQQNADTSASRAAASTANANANYYTDAQGRRVPKGYKYNASGQLVKMATPKAPGSNKKGGVTLANSMASKFRGTPTKTTTKNGVTTQTTLPPKVDYGEAFMQIRDALMGKGYPRPEAEAIAHNALNAYYGKQFRPGKQR